MKEILKYLKVFIILFILMNLLMFASSLFPSTLIEKNVKKTAITMVKEGNNYYISKLVRIIPIVNNNYTDALMINEAYSIDNTDPIYSYMSARKNYKKGLTTETLADVQTELMSFGSSEYYDPVR